jgi:hypothetical protein
MRDIDHRFRFLGSDVLKSKSNLKEEDKTNGKESQKIKLYCKKHGLCKHKTADCDNPDDEKEQKG